MNVFVSPFEVVDDSLVSELFLDNENVLEKLYDALIDVEVVELGDHSLLVLQVFLVLINQCIPFINHRSDILKNSDVHLLLGKRVAKSLVFTFFSLQLVMHGFYCRVVAFKFSDDALLVAAFMEILFNLLKVLLDFWQLFRVSFSIPRFVEQECGFISELGEFCIE